MATNAQQLYADLVGLGLPPGAAIGVVGNDVAESGVDPKAVQPRGPGRGIVQWSLGGRWQQLLAFARSRGADPQEFTTQEAFQVAEMQEMGVWPKLLRITDPTEASQLVMRQYEMPSDQSDANAIHRAQLGAQAVKGGGSIPLLSREGLSAIGRGLIGAPAEAIGGAVAGAAGGAASSAGGAIAGTIRPLLIEGLVAVLGLGLVGVGVVLVTLDRTKRNLQKVI